MPLSGFLERTIRAGRLKVIDANGKSHVFAGGPGPEATVRLNGPCCSRFRTGFSLRPGTNRPWTPEK